jgi:hypothetical protein
LRVEVDEVLTERWSRHQAKNLVEATLEPPQVVVVNVVVAGLSMKTGAGGKRTNPFLAVGRRGFVCCR